jgi:hypothetical protein
LRRRLERFDEQVHAVQSPARLQEFSVGCVVAKLFAWNVAVRDAREVDCLRVYSGSNRYGRSRGETRTHVDHAGVIAAGIFGGQCFEEIAPTASRTGGSEDTLDVEKCTMEELRQINLQGSTATAWWSRVD